MLDRIPSSHQRTRIIPSGRILAPTSALSIFGLKGSSTGRASKTILCGNCFTLPGQVALDTSFVSTDNINNPRSMNAVYLLKERLQHSKRWGQENAR